MTVSLARYFPRGATAYATEVGYQPVTTMSYRSYRTYLVR